jgi:hypothetical protein
MAVTVANNCEHVFRCTTMANNVKYYLGTEHKWWILGRRCKYERDDDEHLTAIRRWMARSGSSSATTTTSGKSIWRRCIPSCGSVFFIYGWRKHVLCRR